MRVEMINGLPKIINQFSIGSSGVLAISASKNSKCTVTPALEVKLLVSSHGFLQTEQFLITIHTRHRTPNHAITNLGSVSKPATKKPAPEYPTAGTGVVVLFRISFVVQRLAVFRTTHNYHPENHMLSGRSTNCRRCNTPINGFLALDAVL